MSYGADTLLLVTTSFPRSNEGSEAAGAFVADLADTLASQVPVRVVAPGEGQESYERRGTVEVHRYASPGHALSLLSPARPSDWGKIATTLASLRRQTLLAGADGKVAHTVALWALPSGWAAAALKRRQGVPYSVWALGSDIWSLGRIPGVRGVLRNVARGARNRYADGIQLSESATRICGCPFQFLPSTRAMPLAPRTEVASAPPYRFLFLGRWHANKGIDLLMDALEVLDDADWSSIGEIHIAGGGPLHEYVHSNVDRLRSAGRPVRLSGYLGKNDAALALADADFLLLPSRIESIPVVFSDAMKAGLPVISCPVGDLPALMGRFDCGYLSEEVSPRSFAAAIRNALGGGVLACMEGTVRASGEFDLQAIGRTLAALVPGADE
jgi:glycosyltransferase involved in cell wall biosynthesis